jgi:hypothetical protein
MQSSEIPEARQSASPSPENKKPEKEEGQGAFAKLLAGLLQKTSKSEAEFAASGMDGSGSGEKSGNPPPAGGAGEVLSVAEGAGEARKGKKPGSFPFKEGKAAEEAAKTDALSARERKRLPSGSHEEQAADGVSADLVADAARARSVPETGGGKEGGEAVRDWGVLSAGTPGAGEEALEADAALAGDGVVLSRTFTGVSDQDYPGEEHRAMEERGLPAGEVSRDALEDFPVEIRDSMQNFRIPVREDAEKDGWSAGETRIRDRRRGRSSSEAGDIRAGLDKRDRAEGPRSFAEAGKGSEASPEGGREPGGNSPGQNSTEQSSVELMVELRSMGKTQAEISTEREFRPLQSFQTTLARELHENLNGDIVRHASVMLRNGGEGTIRLSLKPETLGSVKIRLEITENRITGRIIVESGEAFKAFEQELHALEQSFRDSGFDGANLEMAFASDGREGRQEREGDSLFSGRRAALRYDSALSSAESQEEGQWLGIRLDRYGRTLVNVLV